MNKKKVIFLVILISMFLLIQIVKSDLTITPTPNPQDTKQTTTQQESTDQEKENSPSLPNLDSVKIDNDSNEMIKNITDASKKAIKGGMNNKINEDDLIESILLPESLERISRVLFKIDKEEELNLGKFIILICLSIMLYIIFFIVTKEFLENKLFRALFPLILTLIIGIIGIINTFSKIYLELIKNLFDVSTIVPTIIIVVIVMIVFLIIKYFFKSTKKEQKIEDQERQETTAKTIDTANQKRINRLTRMRKRNWTS